MHKCSYGFKSLFRQSFELTGGNVTYQPICIGEKLLETFVNLKFQDMEQKFQISPYASVVLVIDKIGAETQKIVAGV